MIPDPRLINLDHLPHRIESQVERERGKNTP
jgi:hypothetical protein